MNQSPQPTDPTSPLNALRDKGALWLERTRYARFSRYQTGTDASGDSISAWFCEACGALVEDTNSGCHCCGNSTQPPTEATRDDLITAINRAFEAPRELIDVIERLHEELYKLGARTRDPALNDVMDRVYCVSIGVDEEDTPS